MSLPDGLLWAAPILVLAYAIYGLTGFGSTITGLPLLLFFQPITVASPVMQLFDIVAGLLVGVRSRKSAALGELARLLPFSAIGIAAGLVVFSYAPEYLLRLTLGFFLISYSAWCFLNRGSAPIVSSRWAILAGLSGGVFTALFGTGGPIYSIYLSRRLRDLAAFRASISIFVMTVGLCRLSWFVFEGYYFRGAMLTLLAYLFPCMLFGLFIGNALRGRVSAQTVLHVVWTMLLVAGLGLVFRQ
ncbi:sulfite exporter TauE/SafE family protein [Hoeflea sp. WL0058]|uniref:Probable membrane transporter protein n=1 Tax=Flavimaribacter sediminis TaxID=2865987 RepID=A0AAE2ZQT7_9HYPH|nr:sulfite exporter TauE/SafE family protein [Flavimaribacter sediminis]MBW8639075.1 sulfite exporter TauE/SafE family protein [Flavimaribacter sediminis]